MTDSRAIVRVGSEPQLPEAVEDELRRLRERFWRYADASTSPNTKVLYARAWQSFCAWCATKGLDALPAHPEAVAWYAIALVHGEAGRAKPLQVSSVLTELAAITHAHVEHQLPPPTRDPYLRVILRGLRREHGRPAAAADPLLPRHVRALVASIDPDLTGIRDLALLTFGFASALRRSELAKLQVEQLRFQDAVCVVQLTRSKGDQEGEGQRVAVDRGSSLDTCPVRALQAWLGASGARQGPVFRKVARGKVVSAAALSERAIDALVRRYVTLAGLRAPGVIPIGRYSAHSLRAGCATAMQLAGKSPFEIRDHLRHRSLSSTMRYVRLGKVLDGGATRDLGL